MSSTDRPNAPIESPHLSSAEEAERPDATTLSRRRFLAGSGVAAAAAALPSTFLAGLRKASAAVLPAATITDALGGVVAFVVPGTDADPYSVQQGLVHPAPGGVEGNAVLALEFGLNQVGAAPPPFDGLAEVVAATLEQLTPYVNPAPSGPFASGFANLSFAEKAGVFAIMDADPFDQGLAPLANSLLIYAGLMSYSEAGVLDPFTGTLVAPPVGWAISDYGGVSDGHADFQGYYRDRRSAG